MEYKSSRGTKRGGRNFCSCLAVMSICRFVVWSKVTLCKYLYNYNPSKIYWTSPKEQPLLFWRQNLNCRNINICLYYFLIVFCLAFLENCLVWWLLQYGWVFVAVQQSKFYFLFFYNAFQCSHLVTSSLKTHSWFWQLIYLFHVTLWTFHMPKQ